MQCGENLLSFKTRFGTPAGGLTAWWRMETWAREGGIPWIPAPGRRCPGQVRAEPADPGMDPDRAF